MALSHSYTVMYVISRGYLFGLSGYGISTKSDTVFIFSRAQSACENAKTVSL